MKNNILKNRLLPAILCCSLLFAGTTIRAADSDATEYIVVTKDGFSAETVMNEICRRINADGGYCYSAVFSGFSLTAPAGAYEAIASSEGVAAVFPSSQMRAASAEQEETSAAAVLDYEENTTGYEGRGQVIAIIDTEFDTNHYFFSQMPEQPRLSKDDIKELMTENEFNIDVSANQVYKNEKIPFVYNYATASSDTFDSELSEVHGTHVAGIAAGNGGSMPDGSPYEGTASQAQLVLMAISDNGLISDAAALAAVDDAVKLGVDAINLSFGADSVSSTAFPLEELIYENVREAGIYISTSSGNTGRGQNMQPPSTENIDYATLGIPGSYSSTTAVGSIDTSFHQEAVKIMKLGNGSEVKYTDRNKETAFDSAFSDKLYPYVYCGFGELEEIQDIEGKIALVIYTEDTDVAKVTQIVFGSGGLGIVFWGTGDRMGEIPVMSDLPIAYVTRSEGVKLFRSHSQSLRTTGEIRYENYEEDGGGEISYFSSYGTTGDLELKPELTAPGGYIYSSIPDDEYVYMSGTSMAAPFAAGAAAVIGEYIDGKPFSARYNNLRGSEQVDLTESLLMSTADIVRQENGAAYSPRVQGAGLININDAVRTPAVLIGDNNRSKLSLGDGLQNEFSFTFTVRNLTDSALHYRTSAELMTDGAEDGLISNTVPFPSKVVMPENITVAPRGETEVTAMVFLDEEFTYENSLEFTNGFFIDGYVHLEDPEGEDPALSMPFTGFFGDWDKAPMFGDTLYDDNSLFNIEEDNFSVGTLLISGASLMGANMFTDDLYAKRELIALSPNNMGTGDSVLMLLSPLRSADRIKAVVTDKDGSTVIEQAMDTPCVKYTGSLYTINGWSALDDGEYTLTVWGDYFHEQELEPVYSEDGSKTTPFENWLAAYLEQLHPTNGEDIQPPDNDYDSSYSLPIIIDRELPHIDSLTEENGLLTAEVSDNHYIQAVTLSWRDSDGILQQQTETFTDIEKTGERNEVTAEFSLEGVDIDSAAVHVFDYAMNTTVENLRGQASDVTAQVESVQRLSGMTYAAYSVSAQLPEPEVRDFVLVFYDGNGKLIGQLISSAELKPGETTLVEFRGFQDTQGTAQMRLFCRRDGGLELCADNKTYSLPWLGNNMPVG